MTTVLSVAYPFAPVGPDAVGGAEQVVAALDAALVAAGWRSVVLACPGSRVAGRLVTTPALPAVIDDDARRTIWATVRAWLEALAPRVDLVHLHGLDFTHYLPRLATPTVATLHLPLDWYPRLPAGVQLVCVSRAQRTRGGPGFAQAVVVENGVVLPPTAPLRKRGFALTLGRICPEKGLHDAVEAARRAGVPLGIGGRAFPYPAHQRYLREELAPRLDRQRRLLGVVAGARKERLLAAARCLLVPSLVEETSSLAALEALAAGTPVVARRIGALPEIVEHGRTGFLVDDVGEMAAAIDHCRDLNPADCRRAAHRRFSAARMRAEYLALYRSLMASDLAAAHG
jgi:glycosyltransferase involved in cell wall biosynthesis